ncbi:MAG TPA: hypothetical protein IGS53_02050 [Leptolyngbyaceae cyanobacterium M33_DOE_097]|uniref:Uncharacterized protein n=1 Tax=Oscillatoriales cyanobacterium SpSt-418 TaxID=2282169 RepID=A0A7C3PJN9_9CYAN|nr:hypothetical protein [Leptolyngbyaceae cyanobacterium M33_DOE_097]
MLSAINPQESLHHRPIYFTVDNFATHPPNVHIARESGLDAGAWYDLKGVKRELDVPLLLNDKLWGHCLEKVRTMCKGSTSGWRHSLYIELHQTLDIAR